LHDRHDQVSFTAQSRNYVFVLERLKGGGALTHATACSVDSQFRRHCSTPAACTCACACRSASHPPRHTSRRIARTARAPAADGTCACMHARSPRGLPPRSHCHRTFGTRTRTRAPAHARSASTFSGNMPPYSPTAPVQPRGCRPPEVKWTIWTDNRSCTA
jgi:hypothetical protein